MAGFIVTLTVATRPPVPEHKSPATQTETKKGKMTSSQRDVLHKDSHDVGRREVSIKGHRLAPEMSEVNCIDLHGDEGGLGLAAVFEDALPVVVVDGAPAAVGAVDDEVEVLHAV